MRRFVVAFAGAACMTLAGCGTTATTPLATPAAEAGLTTSSSCADWAHASSQQQTNYIHKELPEVTIPAKYHGEEAAAYLFGVIAGRCHRAESVGRSEATDLSEVTNPGTTGASEAAAAPDANSPPAFTLQASSKEGDRVTIQGRFGPILPATQVSAAPDAEEHTCVQTARSSVVQLTLTVALTSNVPATVELMDMGFDPFGSNMVEIERTTGEGGCMLTELSLGQLKPNEPSTVTLWVWLAETTTPNTPHPSIKLLTERWRLAIPQIVINEDHYTQTRITGPQVASCERTNADPDRFIAISPEIPRSLKARDEWGGSETQPCSRSSH